MWNEPDPDPGGRAPEVATSSRELTDLKDQNEQQQLMIAQLKEMLRKEQSSVPQEKVEEYIHTLSKVKAKKSRSKRDESGSTERHAGIDSHQKERLNLLKQQLEENKAKLAERGKNQKGIEEMVTQLKAQLNDSQQMIGPISALEPKNLEYSKNSSSEELYNILLVREKKITELTSRTQKQEATILDLQENLKEKDSVIDARTKAITLMTESLSKKGKDTLDALDDTKEQMKVMQENFVKLESEMKARQMVLLNDLKTKNLEIAELQELNHNLIEENKVILKGSKSEEVMNVDTDVVIRNLQEKVDTSSSEIIQYKDRITELEKQLSESLDDLERLKNTGATVAPKDNDGEVTKLKKQLEENNKSMIKLKAQSKSKIKDLTKRIENFKKMSDANALIVQLQNENTKLSERIADLEEEKGNMQLKMVESTESSKDINISEEFMSLEKDLHYSKSEVLEKDKIISLLEEEIVSLKDEIKSLNEKITTFSHLENMQVTTEMKSIQIEEELDKLSEENSSLKKKIEAMVAEKAELIEKIENLIKEKNGLNLKLETYIQENMELIDKLEKLSAEKVSSAESIEIVEGLTQQEKIELAAYQKNIEQPMKCSQDEENLEAPPELNESVMQLTEDSDELLKKIEMFNAERKEVMSKMEELKEENNRLIMRVHEVENNRDILAETYEQVQTEKEELQQKNEELLMRMSEMEERPQHTTDACDSLQGTNAEIKTLQDNYEELINENEQLKLSLKDFHSITEEKSDLESKLEVSKSKAKELESKLQNNLDELTNYQCIIEENKNELINYSNIINDLQLKLNERENDVKELNELINDLNRIVSNLQAENEKLGNFELMEAQVGELKNALNKQIEQAEDYNEELERCNETIGTLNSQLEQMKKKILETEHDMEIKDIELRKIENQLVQKDAIIANLQTQVGEKEQSLNGVIEEMKQKYLLLQKNLDGNNQSVTIRIEELTTKNKEQLEKMKKLAANLKKKTQALRELEEKYQNDKMKWEVELNEKDIILSERSNKIEELSNALQETEQIKVNLQHMLQEARQKQERITEFSLQQELSTSLHEEFDNRLQIDHNSASEDKLKELELIIETNEAELAHFKERSQHLEECVMKLTEEKDILNRQGSEMEQQLSEMSKNMEDKMLLEVQLTDKLREIEKAHEDLIKKLDEMNEDNRELSQKFKEQEELIAKLKVKLKKAHEKVTQLKAAQANLEELEKVNASLKKQLEELEVNQKHSQVDHDELQRRNRMEMEKIEADYQAQMAQLSDSRNYLAMECERLNEHLRDLQEKVVDLTSELNEYKQKIEEIETEDGHQIQKLSDELKMARDNWKVAINQIETLSQQLEDVQKQIVLQSAQETVDNVLSKAVLAVYEMNTVETQTDNNNSTNESSIIVTDGVEQRVDVKLPVLDEKELTTAQQAPNWSDGNHQFTNSQQLGSVDMKIENSHEELADKVKALEFLLYNIDKEKEEVVKECTGMVNELTRLIYDKVNNTVRNQPLISDLDLESQILTQQDIVDSANKSNSPLQKLEFIKCDTSLGKQNQPVVEEVCQAKQAYQTYQPVVPEPFGENDDGWGCFGPEEARLEEEHIQRTESTPQVQTLRNEILQLTSKLHSVQAEKDNYIEEIKQLQAKLAKVLKKCKELKAKNDQLLNDQKSSKKAEGTDFFDLDATIQEELKSQISHLEKRLNEVSIDLEKEKLEKSNILKKCDVLTTANDRMVEMKEIQDSEILRWKRKYEEVEEQLQKHDWNNSDGFAEAAQPIIEKDESSEDLEELKNTIKELSIDNEELQALLNEQRNLRIEAEKNRVTGKNEQQQYEERIHVLEKQLSMKCEELEIASAEKEQSISQLKSLVQEKQNFLEEITQKNNELEATIQALRDKESCNQSEFKIQLESILNEKDSTINELSVSLNNMRSINEDLGAQLEILQSNLHSLQEKYQQLELTNSQLQNEVDDREQEKNKQDQVAQLVHQLEQQSVKFNEQERDYLMKIAETEKELLDNKQIVNELQRELDEQKQILVLREEQKEKEEIIMQLEEDLARQRNLNEELKQSYLAKIENLEKEIAFNSQQLGQQEQHQQSNDDEHLLQEKELEIKQLKSIIDDLTSVKLSLEEDLQRAREDLEEKQKQLANLEGEMQQKLADTVLQLEQRWQEQVDERGNTVAESWKYHLTMVETEFANIQEKLKAEIDELEAKCNALVNENNELRKNVDAEIRNELDRVAAMKQQIDDRQQTIQKLQKENNALRDLEQRIDEKENALASLKLIADTTQQQFEEKREVVEEIVKILERTAPWPLSCDKQTVVSEFERQLADLSKKDDEITRLNARIIELQIQFNTSQEKEAEIFRLQQQIATLHEKESEIERLRDIESQLQKMVFDLQNREEQETARLTKIIEDYKVQVNENQHKLNQLMDEKISTTKMIEDIQQNQNDLRTTYETLQTTVGEKDREITSLKLQLEQAIALRNDNNKDVEHLQQQITQQKQDLTVFEQALVDCQNQLYSANQEIEEKTNQLQMVTQQLDEATFNAEKHAQELQTLQNLVNAKEHEHEMIKQSRIQEMENYYKEALSAKDIDIQSLRTQLNEALAAINQYTEQLAREAAAKSEAEITVNELQQRLSEQTALFDEESKQLSEMRSIIEDQVVKIEELKKELFQKSNDYDSLIAEMDIERKATITQQPKAVQTLQVQSSSSTSQTEQEKSKETSQRQLAEDDDLSEPVSRAELDLALYMLHQRDVRCEELMVELTQLLEERDTLQLRLSNAIREKEEIRRRVTNSTFQDATTISSSTSQEPSTPPQSKSSAILLAASGIELASEPSEVPSSEHDLASKLSELRRVGYKKDKTFVDEQELRRMQQMSIMQQHIQDASKLPAEAAAKLVDASYTLSRDVQSPSKVLLNWLWGRSTPKVNDT